jgi:hypothetical protein
MLPSTQRAIVGITAVGFCIIICILYNQSRSYNLDTSKYVDRQGASKLLNSLNTEFKNGRAQDDRYVLKEFAHRKAIIQDASSADLIFVGNSEVTLQPNMSLRDADIAFVKFVNKLHFTCRKSMRLGKLSDGGWDMCVVPPFVPDSPCLIYSFGINNDFSFDDAAASTFNCTIRAFDPSMKVNDHLRGTNIWFYKTGLDGKNYVNNLGWNMMTFSSILEKFGESNKTIDYLKFDIEVSEWPAIDSMIATGVLSRVRQLAVEIHPPGWKWTADSLYYSFQKLKLLEDAGMRRWYVAMNSYDIRRTPDGLRTCCYEIVYINANFIPALQTN